MRRAPLAGMSQEREKIVVDDGGSSSDEDSQQPLSEHTFSKIAGFAGTLGTELERHEYKQLPLLAQLGRRPRRRKRTAPDRLNIARYHLVECERQHYHLVPAAGGQR